jgi:outer membrane lipoprotein-sorting protein
MRRFLSRAVCALFTLSAVVAAQSPTADELVAKNIQAKGGEAKWKSLTSVKLTGTMSAQGKELPLVIYSKRPNLMRNEATFGATSMVQAFDGTTAWAINPLTGAAQELPPAPAEAMRSSADFEGALLDYKSKGHTVELIGPEQSDGADVYHLKLTLKNGTVQDYYLDAKTGLESKMTQQVDVGTGAKQSLTTVMGDYRDVDGVTVPHLVRQLLDGKVVGEMRIQKVEFNTITDDSIFKMPSKAPAK